MISVLLPVYNCQEFLDEAIISLRQQSLVDFELVVVNDGSTDNSSAIIKRHATEDDRIVVINRTNGGIVDALKTGLTRCRGDLIARMDGDDICCPDRLARQAEFLCVNDDVVCVGSRARFVTHNGRLISSGIGEAIEHDQLWGEVRRGFAGSLIHPTVMMRREAVERVGGYRKEATWIEDLDLFIRLGRVGRLHVLRDVLITYRQHPLSVNMTRHEEQRKAWWWVMEDAARVDGKPPPERKFEKNHIRFDPQLRRSVWWAFSALREGRSNDAFFFWRDWVRRRPSDWRAWRFLLLILRGWLRSVRLPT